MISDNTSSVEKEVVSIVETLPTEIKTEDYMPMTDSKNVEKFVNDYFKDAPVMSRIAWCESRYRQYDKTGRVLKGEVTPLDRGVMQINLYYHGKDATKMGLDLHKIEDNVKYARHLYETQGVKPWMSSSKCWMNAAYVASEIAKR